MLPSGLVRQYSLCGDPDDTREYRIAVLAEDSSRGGSKEVHDTALVGRRLMARGPRNHFPLVEADDYLFLAGGIGITPLVPMLVALGRRGRPWRLLYRGRRRGAMAFLDELVQLPGGRLEVYPGDESARFDLGRALAGAGKATAVYCCGPPSMIAAVEEHAARVLAPGTLHLERFVAPEGHDDACGGAPGEAAGSADGAFEVELARSGLVLDVPPGRSLLSVVLEAVPAHLYSCEEGYCGTCEASVLAGEPEHRDTVLSDEERAANRMILCVGRSRSPRLVLDL